MGFYYDKQLKNKDYTIRLWGNGPSYDKLLAIAIFNDNFDFEIGNSWTDFGGDPLGSLWNSTVNPMAPYVGSAIDKLGPALKDLLGKWNTNYNNNLGRKVATGVKGMLNNIIDNGKDYANKNLVVQGTRFVYYSGTDIQMGNMMMKFTLFHEDKTPVTDQLGKLMPYIIGDFKPMGGTSDEEVNKVLSMIGWQDPPGGFKAGYKNVDTIQEGTVMLEFGRMFKIDNLVIKSGSFSLSRVRAKSRAGVFSPLSADISLTFQFAGMITKNKLLEYTGIPSIPTKSNGG